MTDSTALTLSLISIVISLITIGLNVAIFRRSRRQMREARAQALRDAADAWDAHAIHDSTDLRSLADDEGER